MGRDGTLLLSGLNASALASVPVLDITDAPINIFVGTGSSAGKVRIEVRPQARLDPAHIGSPRDGSQPCLPRASSSLHKSPL